MVYVEHYHDLIVLVVRNNEIQYNNFHDTIVFSIIVVEIYYDKAITLVAKYSATKGQTTILVVLVVIQYSNDLCCIKL